MGKGALSESIPGPAAQRRDNLSLPPTVASRVLARWYGVGGVPERGEEVEAWLASRVRSWGTGQGSGVAGGWHALAREATVLLRAHREQRVGSVEECAVDLVAAAELYRLKRRTSWDVVLLALERVRAAVEAQLREEQRRPAR